MRIVADSNVLVAAAVFPRSVSRRAVEAILDTHDLILTPATQGELWDVIRREKFDWYGELADRFAYAERIGRLAVRVSPIRLVRLCRDPRDDMFLDAALAANADFLVTADDDLLVHDPFGATRILRPHEFLAALAR